MLQTRVPLVVMGVSGSGKSTFGTALAEALALPFVDGDALHPQSNIEKMRRAEPLTDEDRAPWLAAIAACLADSFAHPRGIVIACSALRVAYRRRLRCVAGVRFVFLDAERSLIEARLSTRTQHFMPTALIASQFATLERPTSEETDVLTLPATLTPGLAIQAATDYLRGRN